MPQLPPVALILFSNDLDRFLPNVERERKAIEEALEHFDVSNRLKVITRSSVSIEEVFRLFARYRGRIALFHFAGHANGSGLQLNRDFSDKELGRAIGLAELFELEVKKGCLEFVFLNGCSTQGQVELFKAAGVPSLIATRHPIDDHQALQVAKQFYERLANTHAEQPFAQLPDLQEAYQHAVSFLSAKQTVEMTRNQRDLLWAIELSDAQTKATWELFSEQPDWRLPHEPAGLYSQQQSFLIVQRLDEGKLLCLVNDQKVEIEHSFEAFIALLDKHEVTRLVAGEKVFHAQVVTQENFGFIINQAQRDKSLPEDLQRITDRNRWVQSLAQALQRQNVPVRNNPREIINYYGWLIETHLQKMLTKYGQAGDHRALSFMTEAWFSSLRYLCYIQLAQVLKQSQTTTHQITTVQSFLSLKGSQNGETSSAESRFDYLGFLVDLYQSGEEPFISQMHEFMADLLDPASPSYGTMLFLEKHRNRLLDHDIMEEELPSLIPQYLTGLTYWLRRLAFLAHYRLVSIKDINLSYRLGTAKNFVHLYGELHGMYDEVFSLGEDYNRLEVEQYFTYNHSVLLFRGNNIIECMHNIHDPDSYLSLSPLVIDQSVFTNKETQTPEIYFYLGQVDNSRHHFFAQYKNELPLASQPKITSNKTLKVSFQNDQQPKLDALFEQLTKVFNPFKTQV